MDSSSPTAKDRRSETQLVLLQTLPCANSQSSNQSRDDWSGISDQKRRKKAQNRLNQRALRQRRRAGRDSSIRNPSGLTLPQGDELHEIETVHILHAHSDSTKLAMQRLEQLVRSYYGSPRTDLLLRIIQFNFSKALIENIKVLGLSSEDLHDDALSPFNAPGPRQTSNLVDEASLPNGLQPTAVQRAILHHPWLDLLPIPAMRDNLIRAEETYDEERLCLDMKGHGSMVTGKTGAIVWRDPWDPTGWEVSETFARDWSWVIWGCDELFRSTNFWRA